MVSRETAVILASLMLVVPVAATVEVVLSLIGVSVSGAFVSFLVAPGVALVLPQLYLAATDDSVRPRTRIRFSAAAVVLFAFLTASNTDGLERTVVLAIAGGTILALVGYEFITGYRSADDGSVARSG